MTSLKLAIVGGDNEKMRQLTVAENRKEIKEEVRGDVGNIIERLSDLQGDAHIYPIFVLLMEAIFITIRLVSATLFNLLSSAILASHSIISSALFSAKMAAVATLRFYTGWLLVIVKFVWKL